MSKILKIKFVAAKLQDYKRLAVILLIILDLVTIVPKYKKAFWSRLNLDCNTTFCLKLALNFALKFTDIDLI